MSEERNKSSKKSTDVASRDSQGQSDQDGKGTKAGLGIIADEDDRKDRTKGSHDEFASPLIDNRSD